VIGAAEFSKKGIDMFKLMGNLGDEDGNDEEEYWESLLPDPNFYQYMLFIRWKKFCDHFPDCQTFHLLPGNQNPLVRWKQFCDHFPDCQTFHLLPGNQNPLVSL
jgi:hypothetical protein